ncbi:archease [Bacteroidota bacterium]
MSFRFIPHQADVRILVKGNTYKDIFASALNGLCEVILPEWGKVYEKLNIKEIIEVESIDITALLIDFLSDILSLMHQNKALFCKVQFEQLSETYLIAEVSGFEVSGFDEDVKAVTYHEADVKLNENGLYETVIVLDI